MVKLRFKQASIDLKKGNNMKRIKIFEFRACYTHIDKFTQNINDFLQELHQKGKLSIEIIVTTTDKGAVYTLIWEE